MSDQPRSAEIKDWTGRHVRLKFEMTIAAAVFFVVTQFCPSGLKLPFLEVSGTVEPNSIRIATLGFALFTLIGFIARTDYEATLFKSTALASRKEIKLFSTIWENMKPDLISLQNEVDEYRINEKCKKQILPNDSRVHWSINYDLNYEKSVYKNLQEPLKTVQIAINHLQSIISELTIDVPERSPISEIYWRDLQSKTMKLQKQLDFLNKISTYPKNHKGVVQATLSEEDGLRRKPIELMNTYGSFFISANKVRARLHRQAISRFFQERFLSIYVPIAFSTIAIGLSLYQWVF